MRSQKPIKVKNYACRLWWSSKPRGLRRHNWSSVCTSGETGAVSAYLEKLEQCLHIWRNSASAAALRSTLESSRTAHPALTWSNPHFTAAQIQELKPCFWSNTVVPAGAKVIEELRVHMTFSSVKETVLKHF